jgi:hypothetical protein
MIINDYKSSCSTTCGSRAQDTSIYIYQIIKYHISGKYGGKSINHKAEKFTHFVIVAAILPLICPTINNPSSSFLGHREVI